MIELQNVSFTYVNADENTEADVYGVVNGGMNTGESTAGREQSEGDGSKDCSHAADAVLKNVSLHVEKGELVILTGTSGCGKTTVLRIINGLIPRYHHGRIEGCAFINGKDISSKEIYELSGTVGTVFQNPRSQFFNVDTTSEMAFTCENLGMPVEEIKKRLYATVGRFKMEHLVDRNIFKLSGGEKQKVACASVDVTDPEVILLDEPSANLDYEATLQLRKIIEEWKLCGKTIIAVEHRLGYLWQLADRLVVLENGGIKSITGKESFGDYTPERLASAGLRTCLMESPFAVDLPELLPDDEYMSLYDFNFSYRRGIFRKAREYRSFSYGGLKIALNRITAVVGRNGAGKTTFLNCLCGLNKKCPGTVEIAGRRLSTGERSERFFMVMQDVNHQLFAESVLNELELCFAASNTAEEDKKRIITGVLKQLDLYSLRHAHPMSLSGGQKQRVAIACALCSGKDFLLFDEPTSGLDYFHMKEVAGLFQSLKELGKTIIVVTHDSELIRCCCDHKIVIGEGK